MLLKIRPWRAECRVFTNEEALIKSARGLVRNFKEKNFRRYCDTGAVCLMSPANEGGKIWFMLLPPEFDRELVYHEVLHLVHYILQDRGVPSRWGNSEVQAYMQGDIAEEIARRLYGE